MSHLSLSRKEYIEIGQSKNLALVGNAPLSVYDKADWRCTLCRKNIKKTLRGVRFAENGCSCTRYKAVRLSRKDYVQLGENLGITFVDKAPTNNKTPVEWLSRVSKNRVRASYHNLAYSKIPNKLIELLEL